MQKCSKLHFSLLETSGERPFPVWLLLRKKCIYQKEQAHWRLIINIKTEGSEPLWNEAALSAASQRSLEVLSNKVGEGKRATVLERQDLTIRRSDENIRTEKHVLRKSSIIVEEWK